MAVSVDKILSNLNNFTDLGRKRALELSNPYYYHFIQAFSRYAFRNDRLSEAAFNIISLNVDFPN
ncbi:hypothetical protein [Pedobacter sp. CFBP9032]|uniref:hypothetical protein n=1 Tax=Pedobacter sp. CFBP9032 TaxID=3096539 RepID=UPI002A6B020E|nr:hypothetical protein [Pedobacter sp. CFBP9032]MDY0905474.1 hypothetical protein [Pedobacter sp. CFBP9032]